MRKLIVQQWVTVDNIAAEEDGGLSFVSGEPFSETTNNGLPDGGGRVAGDAARLGIGRRPLFRYRLPAVQ
jgi:hypothetical protein